LKVSTKNVKWSKVKVKTADYFKTISIPGVSKIVTTESYLLKLLWTVVILCVFGFGFEKISQSVSDYYKYDKITNIERVNPENVTFPAITICTGEGYSRELYRNGSLIKRERVFSDLFKQFLDFEKTGFYLSKNNTLLDVKNHLDIFKVRFDGFDVSFIDCLRFNAVTNRSIKLFKASSIEDSAQIFLNRFYRENISSDEYYRYSLYRPFFLYYKSGDNSLNSYGILKYFLLKPYFQYRFEIEKVSIENKLPEPYNPCKKSSVDEPYHQMNCIEACSYKEIKNKYNCTYHSTLFSIQGLRECVRDYRVLETEFSVFCLSECPLESCFSEKFTFDFSASTEATQFGLNWTKLSFSFRDLSTLNITQIPKTDWFTFINNIGGGLGLFMGIAIPSLIEFFQFILEIVLIIFIRQIN
jgi:hypothetical protein